VKPSSPDESSAISLRNSGTFLEERAIQEHVVRNLLAWPHTGFGTHVSRTIPADEKTPEVVARYMTRPPITPERMVGEARSAKAIYRSEVIHHRHHCRPQELGLSAYLLNV
jgi:hypothetical protein